MKKLGLICSLFLCIFISCESTKVQTVEEYSENHFETVLENNLDNHVKFFTKQELYGRVSGSKYALKVAEYIYFEFQKIGLETEYEKKGQITNVIGYKPGKSDKENIIGANYDGIYNVLYEGYLTYQYFLKY